MKRGAGGRPPLPPLSADDRAIGGHVSGAPEERRERSGLRSPKTATEVPM
ncbi:MAG: hypothetical protein M3N32_00215 [Actinomycetota bacterium]|nr:hypothetical protein [Actinomycetota bacterium]